MTDRRSSHGCWGPELFESLSEEDIQASGKDGIHEARVLAPTPKPGTKADLEELSQERRGAKERPRERRALDDVSPGESPTSVPSGQCARDLSARHLRTDHLETGPQT